jgi:hypothetical protein
MKKFLLIPNCFDRSAFLRYVAELAGLALLALLVTRI